MVSPGPSDHIPGSAGTPSADFSPEEPMLKRTLLAIAMMAALAACNTPGATTVPSIDTSSPAPIDSGLESMPSDSGLESMEPSEEPSAS